MKLSNQVNRSIDCPDYRLRGALLGAVTPPHTKTGAPFMGRPGLSFIFKRGGSLPPLPYYIALASSSSAAWSVARCLEAGSKQQARRPPLCLRFQRLLWRISRHRRHHQIRRRKPHREAFGERQDHGFVIHLYPLSMISARLPGLPRNDRPLEEAKKLMHFEILRSPITKGL